MVRQMPHAGSIQRVRRSDIDMVRGVMHEHINEISDKHPAGRADGDRGVETDQRCEDKGDDQPNRDDREIAEKLKQKLPAAIPVLQVWNKVDAVAKTDSSVPSQNLYVSAKNAQGLDELRAELLRVAGWQAPAGSVFIARARHLQALQRAQSHVLVAASHLAARAQLLDLLAEELRLAQRALGEITGEFTPDDLLGVIFSQFCIGK